MGTHTGRAFLNSCLKTPIDPCNNCPAPVYNRPKIYLGRLTTTPLGTTATKTGTTKAPSESAETSTEADAGIRSLAKLYDSIPDYCDINHLTEQEFYSTLDTLRSTCRELKSKPLSPCKLDESSNNSSLSIMSIRGKAKKTAKKKTAKTKKCSSKKKSKECNSTLEHRRNLNCITAATPCNEVCDDFPAHQIPISCKEDFQQEVAAFKRTLKDFEKELKSRSILTNLNRAKSTNVLIKSDSPKLKSDEITQTEFECSLSPTQPPPNCTSASCKSIRKAYSFNDIDSLASTEKQQNSVKPKFSLCKPEIPALNNKTKLSNFFPPNATELPKISIQSPGEELTSSNTGTERSCEKRRKPKSGKQITVPFTIFTLGTSPKKKEFDETPSPVHPVARPNLAATLRVEVSKKKVRELQNNCTYHEKIPQFDWEVRKTPAWRSLSLNESHKEILALRLATRRAEQALQQRQYELNMELMRQRVKSAPLLLEGATFWGPNVGKLTHNCQNEGARHACESLQRKQRTHSHAQDTHSDIADSNQLGLQTKLSNLRKIYAISSQSRNSQHSSTTSHKKERRRTKKKNLPKLTSGSATMVEHNITHQSGNDSGDDLCSVDRAFL